MPAGSFPMAQQRRHLEKAIALASFLVAVALCFLSLAINKDHDIAANVCIVVAQFLTLTATLLGIDYKLNGNTKITTRPQEQ